MKHLQIEPPFEHEFAYGGVKGYLIGVTARDTISNQELVGSSFGSHSDEARIKAYAELAERTCALRSAGPQARSSKATAAISNGWAAHPNPTIAKEKAFLEVLERHHILHAWYSGSQPKKIDLPAPKSLQGLQKYAEIFQIGTGSNFVCMTVIHPVPAQKLRAQLIGFAAATTLSLSMDKSAQEALQRWAFLHDEETDPEWESLPASAMFQQEFGLSEPGQALLNQWLRNEFTPNKIPFPTTLDAQVATFKTYETVSLGAPLTVVNCQHPHAIPLVFGPEPQRILAFLPNNDRRWLHPIA